MATALTIAGSDSSGGAGIQADLKSFAAFGVYGLSAITAVTAQNTERITRSLVLPPDLVRAQIDAVVGDVGADATKIGMLGTAPIVAVVAEAIERHGLANIVLDPVLVSTSGDRLLDDWGTEELRRRLVPLARVVTPNLAEAEVLTGIRGSGEGGAARTAFAGLFQATQKGRQGQRLEYEAFEPLALKVFEQIEHEVREHWPAAGLGIHHRIGPLDVGEASVVIVAATAHRADAFHACRYAIERVKQIAPVWKHEFFEDGDAWVEGATADPHDAQARDAALARACA